MLQTEGPLFDMGKGSFPRRKLGASSNALPSATLSSDYFQKCGVYCTGGLPNITVLYYPAASLNVEEMETRFPPDANVSIISGILEVQIFEHAGDQEICPRQACTMTIKIPVDTTKLDDFKYTDCARMNGEDPSWAPGEDGVLFTGFQNSTGLVSCRSTMLGKIFVLQHTVRSPPPSLPPPSPPTQAIFTPSSIETFVASSPPPAAMRDQASPRVVLRHGSIEAWTVNVSAWAEDPTATIPTHLRVCVCVL